MKVKLETIKLPEENIAGSKFLFLGLGDYCLNLTPNAKSTKAKTY